MTARLRWSAVALCAVAAVWLTTLQTDITAGNDSLTHPSGLVDPLMDDSGEFVVAWHTWGVTHPPGYPLLNLAGNVAVRGVGLTGAAPAAAASLVSWVLMLTAFWHLAAIVRAAGASEAAAAAAVLLPAFGELVWLYACVAEAYALGLCLALACLRLAVRAGDRPHAAGPVLALGLVFGLAVGHHRTLLALIPALAVAAWPAWALGPLRRFGPGGAGATAWGRALGLAVLSLGVYAYLPLAARAGSPWIYGRSPATLDGFLDAFLAREYAGQLTPPTTPAAVAAAVAGRLAFLAREITPFGLVLGAAGLALALGFGGPRLRRAALAAAAMVAGFLAAPVSQPLVIGTHLLVMVAGAGLAMGWGLGAAAAATRWPRSGAAALALSAVAAAGAWRAHHSDIAIYAQDPAGRRLVDAVAALPGAAGAARDASRPETAAAPLVVEAWSPRYFALAYGKWATGEVAGVRLVDARSDLVGLDAAAPLPDVVYTTPELVALAGWERWSARLGASMGLESAGDGIVAVRRAPRHGPEPDGSAGGTSGAPSAAEAGSAGAGDRPAVTVERARAWWAPDGDIRLEVEWRAVRAPDADAHVLVHATDRPAVRGPEDILAQADRQHPVYGLYPTSRWTAGQRVRDDYRIRVAPGASAANGRSAADGVRRPRFVEVGLYRVMPDGAFRDLVRRRVAIEPAAAAGGS